MIYLMSPYSDPEPEVREFRYEMAKAAALVLYLRGLGVYSPIVNSHPLADTYGLDRGHDFWWFQNKEMMELSDGAILLTLPGWATQREFEMRFLTTALLASSSISLNQPRWSRSLCTPILLFP
jgi:hypothetical protein